MPNSAMLQPEPPRVLNAEALERELKGALPDFEGPLAIERIAGGQSNPTFFVTSPSHRLVLRKQPDGPILPSAHAVDREYRIQHALRDSAVPVPRMIHFCSDPAVIGTPFYVMERLDGRIFGDNALAGAPREQRAEIYRAAADMMARLHSVDWRDVGLGDYGRPDDYFARQIARWSRQYDNQRTRDMPEIEFLRDWLKLNLPNGSVATIVHGDFRIGNLILHPTRPEVVGVLDWELSTIGDPMADLAHFCLAWDMRADEYGGIADVDFAAQGLPGRENFIFAYGASGGRIEGFSLFHRVFALFRFAVIFEGIAARAMQGNAANDEGAKVGALSLNFARRAVEMIEG